MGWWWWYEWDMVEATNRKRKGQIGPGREQQEERGLTVGHECIRVSARLRTRQRAYVGGTKIRIDTRPPIRRASL